MKISDFDGEVEINGKRYKAVSLGKVIDNGEVRVGDSGAIFLKKQFCCYFTVGEEKELDVPVIMIKNQEFENKLVLPPIGGCTYLISHCTTKRGLCILE